MKVHPFLLPCTKLGPIHLLHQSVYVLLTRNYDHAFNLILICGELDITSEFLIEVDQLVQLIESPIFACEYS